GGVDGGLGATFLRALADVLAHFAEPLRRVDGQAPAGELPDVGALFERLAEVRREDEAAFVVQRVLVPPDERRCHRVPSPAEPPGATPDTPQSTTALHPKPPFP